MLDKGLVADYNFYSNFLRSLMAEFSKYFDGSVKPKIGGINP
jgi:hypothetical protein